MLWEQGALLSDIYVSIKCVCLAPIFQIFWFTWSVLVARFDKWPLCCAVTHHIQDVLYSMLILTCHFLICVLFQVYPCSQPTASHTISAPLEIRSRGWGSSSQAAPSGSSLWGPTRVSQSGGNLWAPSPSGRQWGVSPSHHGDDPWLRFMWAKPWWNFGLATDKDDVNINVTLHDGDSA